MRSTRHNQTLRLMAWIKDRPNQWISALEFEQFGRLCWRTEISRARKKFKAAGDGTIENRPVYGHRPGCAKVFLADLEEDARCDCGGWRRSEYRWVPQREATPTEAHNLNEPAAVRLL